MAPSTAQRATVLDSIYQRCAKHRLLAAAEEVELGRRIQAGGADGLRAKEQLITHNLRLVMGWARVSTGILRIWWPCIFRRASSV